MHYSILPILDSNSIFWILRTGATWRDLPPDYGDWKKYPLLRYPRSSILGTRIIIVDLLSSKAWPTLGRLVNGI